jgi:tRNA-dihydrouridine synthase C
MDGITDAPMRAFQGATGAFTYAVSEFLRVSIEPLPTKVFRREVPELNTGGKTTTDLPVQVQILGGDSGRMAESAYRATKAGALGIDINFGCPAPTVNRHDGGASLLNHPCRIRDIVSAVRQAVPAEIPVSAKLRLGWENIEDVYENAAMAAEGGASWLTIHARTRVQGYSPPVYWQPIGRVRAAVGIPVVANGDIWTFDDFLRCREETGCSHYMLGRSALANPALSHQIARELGMPHSEKPETDWIRLFRRLIDFIDGHYGMGSRLSLIRLKQWTNVARSHGDFPYFDEIKRAAGLEEFFESLALSIEAKARMAS